MSAGPRRRGAGRRRPRKAKAVPPQPAPPKAVPAKPVQPAKPVKPAQAGKPLKPVRRAKPARPARPVAAKPRLAQAPAAAARPVRPSGDPLIGRTLGRCRVEELIGVGRTARVYRAHYEALDDTVAIKVLRAEVATNPVLVERFDSEARAIAKVDNENVLKIYDVGTTEDGLHYMVVELLEGEEVFELIQREEFLDPMDALRIVRQAANGLAAAHTHQLVHRDIKPQNLFLLEDGTVKVVDFGLAASVDESSERVGTPHYMAPEVCELAKAEPASDIYGLGVTLFHLLVGQPPYAGQDIKGIMRSHIAGEPLHPERRRPGLPREVGDIVRLLTKRDPLVRPSALEVVEELDRFGGKELREKETLRGRRRSSRARSAVARRERAGRKTPALIPILAALLAVGAIAALVASSAGDDEPGAPPVQGGEQAPPDQPGGDLVVPGTQPPPETAEETKAREDTLAQRKAAQDAQDALSRAEQWARENWHGPADTDAVLAKYRYVRDRYPGLPAAAEAKQRIKDIRARKRHPHPDREWTSADELAALRATWESQLPKVREHVAAFDYAAARDLVPGSVSDESGRLSREIDFWREHTGYLVEYQRLLAREVPRLAPEERSVTTPDGAGVVQKASLGRFEIKVGPRTKTYTWAQLGAGSLAGLGMAVVSGGEAEQLILQVAFAFAHQLKKPFWDAQIELEFVAGAGPYDRINDLYKKEAHTWAR